MVTGSNPVRARHYSLVAWYKRTQLDGGCSSVGRALDCDSSCRGGGGAGSNPVIHPNTLLRDQRSIAQPGSAPGFGTRGS